MTRQTTVITSKQPTYTRITTDLFLQTREYPLAPTRKLQTCSLAEAIPEETKWESTRVQLYKCQIFTQSTLNVCYHDNLPMHLSLTLLSTWKKAASHKDARYPTRCLMR